MDELIRKQDAIDLLLIAINDGWSLDYAEYKMKALPPVQPKRKKGKWIQNDNGTWSCDQCHSWIPDEQHYYAKYCLYCGAKMERWG